MKTKKHWRICHPSFAQNKIADICSNSYKKVIVVLLRAPIISSIGYPYRLCIYIITIMHTKINLLVCLESFCKYNMYLYVGLKNYACNEKVSLLKYYCLTHNLWWRRITSVGSTMIENRWKNVFHVILFAIY